MGINRDRIISAMAGLALGSLGVFGTTAHAEHYPGHFLVGSSIYDNLSRLVNRPVKVLIKGGGEVDGVVREIGTKLVRLEGPSGEESLVVVDEIAVLIAGPGHP
jgi:hypothetical protein